MVQCKRFRWEDEFNEWVRKENIQGHHVVAIKHSPPDSMMIFYDKNLKEKTYYYGGTYDWTIPQWSSTITTDRTITVNEQPNSNTAPGISLNTVTTAHN